MSFDPFQSRGGDCCFKMAIGAGAINCGEVSRLAIIVPPFLGFEAVEMDAAGV